MSSQEALTLAVDLARKLKKTAADFHGEYTDGIIHYGATGDVTYEVDVPLERAVDSYFKVQKIPCRVMTEDSGVKDYGDDPEYVFLIDPLDGSRNARRTLPMHCCSIAAYDINAKEISEALCAVVARFDADEEFTAERGCGATLNGRRIKPSRKKSLDDAVIAMGCHFASAVPIFAEAGRRLGSQVESPERDVWVKAYGSTALELAFLACGRVDMIYDVRAGAGLKATPKTYDIAAGLLLCQEAGAIVEYGGRRIPQKLALDPKLPAQVRGAGNKRLFNTLVNTLP